MALCTSIGYSPVELLIGHKIITLLDRLHPTRLWISDLLQTPRKHPEDSSLGIWSTQNHRSGPVWVLVRVTTVMGPISYEVSTDGRLVK